MKHADQLEEDFPEKLEKNTKAWSDKLLSVLFHAHGLVNRVWPRQGGRSHISSLAQSPKCGVTTTCIGTLFRGFPW